MFATTQTTQSLQLRRTLPAARERVFRAWTDPADLTRWWGPEGFVCTAAQVDLRVGGRYRIDMKNLATGQEFYKFGTYLEVRIPEKLVYTWEWRGSPMDGSETRVTVEFLDRGASTELVLTHELFPTEAQRDGHTAGWTSLLQQLENHCPNL